MASRELARVSFLRYLYLSRQDNQEPARLARNECGNALLAADPTFLEREGITIKEVTDAHITLLCGGYDYLDSLDIMYPVATV